MLSKVVLEEEEVLFERVHSGETVLVLDGLLPHSHVLP
jgi:hypothetical protein